MRQGYEVYEAWFKGHEEDIEKGRPFDLEIKSCEDFSRKVVKAIISKSKNLKDGKELWIRSYAKDEYLPEPWSIKIVEELDEDTILERPDIVPGEVFKVY